MVTIIREARAGPEKAFFGLEDAGLGDTAIPGYWGVERHVVHAVALPSAVQYLDIQLRHATGSTGQCEFVDIIESMTLLHGIAQLLY